MISAMNVQRQYENIQAELDKVALDVLHSGKYILGEAVESFERKFAEYCGVKYAIGVGNGTDALCIALKACGIGSGDEVITTSMSFIATAEAIAAVGAKPVFVDCTLDTYLIDVSKIEAKITAKTKAVIPVHLYGQCADVDKILELAKKYNLKVIEDAAQAAGAEYKGRKSGSLGDVGCFSFFPTKNLGCAGDGGMITTNDEDIYKKCKAYRVHGSGNDGLYAYCDEKGIDYQSVNMDFGKNLPKYYNFTVGYNSRLDAIQAAILSVKLNHLDEWNERRREIANIYEQQISNPHIKKPVTASGNKHIYYVYPIISDDRDGLRNYLEENGIGSGVYFPVPVNKQKVFEGLASFKEIYPGAENVANNTLVIPMFPELTDEEIHIIIEVINSWKK